MKEVRTGSSVDVRSQRARRSRRLRQGRRPGRNRRRPWVRRRRSLTGGPRVRRAGGAVDEVERLAQRVWDGENGASAPRIPPHKARGAPRGFAGKMPACRGLRSVAGWDRTGEVARLAGSRDERRGPSFGRVQTERRAATSSEGAPERRWLPGGFTPARETDRRSDEAARPTGVCPAAAAGASAQVGGRRVTWLSPRGSDRQAKPLDADLGLRGKEAQRSRGERLTRPTSLAGAPAASAAASGAGTGGPCRP